MVDLRGHILKVLSSKLPEEKLCATFILSLDDESAIFVCDLLEKHGVCLRDLEWETFKVWISRRHPDRLDFAFGLLRALVGVSVGRLWSYTYNGS
jgi:hypothetical protein